LRIAVQGTIDLLAARSEIKREFRAAYAEALTRFDPTELERRTETNPGLLDKLLTNGRKAALWDDYKHNFDVLRRHAEDDLMAFSGRTFVEAYENAEQSVKGQP
jgi:FHA domain-containing protein